MTYNYLFSTHRLMYKKSNSFVYKFVVNHQFFLITPSGCTYKAESSHAWSHGQYFLKHHFIEIFLCAFKNKFT